MSWTTNKGNKELSLIPVINYSEYHMLYGRASGLFQIRKEGWKRAHTDMYMWLIFLQIAKSTIKSLNY